MTLPEPTADEVRFFLMLGAATCAIIGAAYDMRSSRIPNWLTYGGLGLALTLRGIVGSWRAVGQGLAGMLIGGGIFFLFFLVRGMGAGDVKLMSAVSTWVGFHDALALVASTAIAGGILALIYMAFYGKFLRTIRNVGTLVWFHVKSGVRPHPELNLQGTRAIRIPYGVAIAIGTIYLLVSTSILAGVIYGH